MTDRVQKIREEVEKLKSNLIHGACASQIAMETRCKEEAYDEVIAILDTMQEEPVSEELEVELKNYLNSDEYINTLGVSGYLLVARHFANWQKEQDKQWLAERARQTMACRKS